MNEDESPFSTSFKFTCIRSWLAVRRGISLLLLALYAYAPLYAQVPMAKKIYLRTSIEGWTPAEKARLIPFLDECREAADQFSEMFTRGEVETIYSAVSNDLRQQSSLDEFRKTINQMLESVGQTTSLLYVSQALALGMDDNLEKPRRPFARVNYVAFTTKFREPGLYFELFLSKSEGKCRVDSFNYQRYWPTPPWLKAKDGKK